MGDAPDKPDPKGFINLSKKLIGDKLGESNIPIAYVGDTIADIHTVINARKEIPSQKFISIGIAPPHLHLNSRLKERKSYETNLRNAGADLILNSIYELKDIHLICQGLENNGCKITTKPKTMKNSTTVLAFVEDPDGYKIELIERD